MIWTFQIIPSFCKHFSPQLLKEPNCFLSHLAKPNKVKTYKIKYKISLQPSICYALLRDLVSMEKKHTTLILNAQAFKASERKTFSLFFFLLLQGQHKGKELSKERKELIFLTFYSSSEALIFLSPADLLQTNGFQRSIYCWARKF